jgi:hypothetical protein
MLVEECFYGIRACAPNTALELTPHDGEQDRSFFGGWMRSTAVPIYRAAQLSAKPLGHCYQRSFS